MGKLVLVRHGESIWNLQNRFTGWVDVSLSKKGIREARLAGKKLKTYKFDVAYTSTLIRAQETLFEILNKNKNCQEYTRVHEGKNTKWYSHFAQKEEEDKRVLKIHVSDKLNERYYGDLQGLDKNETIKKFGEDKVHQWRRSFDIAPPNVESLDMTSKRTIPYYKEEIVKDLKEGKTVLIAAHGNSLRSIVMHVESMSPDEIINFEMKTGIPHIYEFDRNMNLLYKGKL
jgi:2,3-bisphosphoglycerate-dependent phosphoglycerate mutase